MIVFMKDLTYGYIQEPSMGVHTYNPSLKKAEF